MFIAEGHEKRRNWLNSTISTMHVLIEFNHSNHSGFLNSKTYWIQPIQPILSLMGVPEKTRLWVFSIFFSNEPLDQTLYLMKNWLNSLNSMGKKYRLVEFNKFKSPQLSLSMFSWYLFIVKIIKIGHSKGHTSQTNHDLKNIFMQ